MKKNSPFIMDEKETIDKLLEGDNPDVKAAEYHLKRIRKQNLKVYAKRTLKTIGNFTLVVLPFAASLGLQTIVFGINGSYGNPWVQDQMKKYLYVDGQMDSKGAYHQVVSEGETKDHDKYFKIKIYTPWEKTDNGYERMVYSYDVRAKEEEVKKLEGYIKNGEHEKLRSMIDKPRIGTEKSKEIPKGEEKTYYITADYYIRTGEYVLVDESKKDYAGKIARMLASALIAETWCAATFMSFEKVTMSDVFDRFEDSMTYGVTYSTKEEKEKLKKMKKKK